MIQKKYKIKYFKSFDYEIFEIFYYIYYILQNEIAAENFIINVYDKIKKRSSFPTIFQPYKSIGGYMMYRIYVGNFTIFYRVKENIMEVMHIIYSARNLNDFI